VVLLAILSGLAMVLRDVGFVVSFGGALLGSAVIYIFPALIFIKTIRNKIQLGELQKGAMRNEVIANHLIAMLGVVLAGIGGTVSVLKTFFAH
jgi:solute carrier family 38 (sodium-coupled neutral amino acid transporter), member 11